MKKKWIDPDGQLAIFSLLCDDCPYADCLGAKNAELRSRERRVESDVFLEEMVESVEVVDNLQPDRVAEGDKAGEAHRNGIPEEDLGEPIQGGGSARKLSHGERPAWKGAASARTSHDAGETPALHGGVR
jgi:hypothetical protein